MNLPTKHPLQILGAIKGTYAFYARSTETGPLVDADTITLKIMEHIFDILIGPEYYTRPFTDKILKDSVSEAFAHIEPAPTLFSGVNIEQLFEAIMKNYVYNVDSEPFNCLKPEVRKELQQVCEYVLKRAESIRLIGAQYGAARN